MLPYGALICAVPQTGPHLRNHPPMPSPRVCRPACRCMCRRRTPVQVSAESRLQGGTFPQDPQLKPPKVWSFRVSVQLRHTGTQPSAAGAGGVGRRSIRGSSRTACGVMMSPTDLSRTLGSKRSQVLTNPGNPVFRNFTRNSHPSFQNLKSEHAEAFGTLVEPL